MELFSLILILFIVNYADNSVTGQPYKLKQLNIIKDKVTLSGFSAGASMATQLHISYSSLFSGIGIFGQAFYRCGPNSLTEFSLRCSTLSGKSGHEVSLYYDVAQSIKDTKRYEKSGQIQSLQNLSHQKIFIWVAGSDEFIIPALAKQNQDFYNTFIPNSQIFRKVEPSARHLFPTDNFGANCNQNAEYNLYLGNCDYSGAYESLAYLLGTNTITKSDTNQFDLEQLKVFNQSEFYISEDDNLSKDISKIGMGELGLIYIPKACESDKINCLLHFHFHGCNEWPLNIARNYTFHNGFLPLAEKNNIIVIFPLTTTRPDNMNGCWDFFSFTGSNFATMNGKQIKVVHRMYQRLVNGNLESTASVLIGSSNLMLIILCILFPM